MRAECGVVVEEGRGWVRAPAVAFCRGGANGGGGAGGLKRELGEPNYKSSGAATPVMCVVCRDNAHL